MYSVTCQNYTVLVGAFRLIWAHQRPQSKILKPIGVDFVPFFIPKWPEYSKIIYSGTNHNHKILVGTYGDHFGANLGIFGPIWSLRVWYWSHFGDDFTPFFSPKWTWKAPKRPPEFSMFMACAPVNNLGSLKSFWAKERGQIIPKMASISCSQVSKLAQIYPDWPKNGPQRYQPVLYSYG